MDNRHKIFQLVSNSKFWKNCRSWKERSLWRLATIVLTTGLYLSICFEFFPYSINREKVVEYNYDKTNPFVGKFREKQKVVDSTAQERKKYEFRWNSKEAAGGDEIETLLERREKIKLLLKTTMEYMQQTELITDHLTKIRKRKDQNALLNFRINSNLTTSLIRNDIVLQPKQPKK